MIIFIRASEKLFIRSFLLNKLSTDDLLIRDFFRPLEDKEISHLSDSPIYERAVKLVIARQAVLVDKIQQI